MAWVLKLAPWFEPRNKQVTGVVSSNKIGVMFSDRWAPASNMLHHLKVLEPSQGQPHVAGVTVINFQRHRFICSFANVEKPSNGKCAVCSGVCRFVHPPPSPNTHINCALLCLCFCTEAIRSASEANPKWKQEGLIIAVCQKRVGDGFSAELRQMTMASNYLFSFPH